jgi:hypothetical protein
MIAGPVRKGMRPLQSNIARTIEEGGVPKRLAARISMQLAIKFSACDLGDRETWRAMGGLLRRESERLRADVGLVDRQIIEALPKLAPQQIASFLTELRESDPTIARTILNAALDAAEPLVAGRRYLAEFHRVVGELESVDPRIARTIANATFMARVPRMKAMEHVKKFADLMKRFSDDVDCVRTVARAAFRARDPIKAAQRFIADYDAVVRALTSDGVESNVARSLAGIAGASADPLTTALKLQRNFQAVLQFVQQTHPWVARSIALSACRASDPLRTARVYMRNYDTIVRVIGRMDARRAHHVAAQAFRSYSPLRWARRYLAQLQEAS